MPLVLAQFWSRLTYDNMPRANVFKTKNVWVGLEGVRIIIESAEEDEARDMGISVNIVLSF